MIINLLVGKCHGNLFSHTYNYQICDDLFIQNVQTKICVHIINQWKLFTLDSKVILRTSTEKNLIKFKYFETLITKIISCVRPFNRKT